MISISDKTTPKSSYKNILKNPLTKRIFANTLSQLGIQDSTKIAIVDEFTKTINNFEDPIYTGDIDHFKINLYTTLNEIKKENINLVNLLSTEEFISKSTMNIENLISIFITDNNTNVSLDEYIKFIRKNNIIITSSMLPVLRGLIKIESNGHIHRDTSELAAAIKKHLIETSTSNSISKLLSLVKKSKQNETVMREDELYYYKIKSHIDTLYNKINSFFYNYQTEYVEPKYGSINYSKMIDDIKSALLYFAHDEGYKKEKFNKLIFDFFEYLIKNCLSEYRIKELRIKEPIEFKKKLEINDIITFVENYQEYKTFIISCMIEKERKLIEKVKYSQQKVENFYRPSRKERSYGISRGFPIKSDQEYSRELDYAKLYLKIHKKNLDLIKSYISTIKGNNN